MSPKRPQKCQETTRLEKKRCLGKRSRGGFGVQNGLPNALGDSPDGSGLTLRWLQKSQVPNPNSTCTNFVRTGFGDSRLNSDAKRVQIPQTNF